MMIDNPFQFFLFIRGHPMALDVTLAKSLPPKKSLLPPLLSR